MAEFPESATTASPASATPVEDDSISVTSTGSTDSEERRRRRNNWRREHETQLKVDGTFPRRNSSIATSREVVSQKVITQHLGTKTTASLHTLPPAVSDSVRVRSNLLRTLGIQKRPVAADDTNTAIPKEGGGGRHRRIQSADGRSLLSGQGGDVPMAAASKKPPPPPNRPLLSNVRMNEELKYDSDEDEELTQQQSKEGNNYYRFFGTSSSNSGTTTSKSADAANQNNNKNLKQIPRRRRLLFSESVTVVPIPMRSEYSNRIKERMYSNRIELSENAQRNVVEFEAEGWDASTVLDDENQFYKCPLTGELIHPVHLSYFKGEVEGER